MAISAPNQDGDPFCRCRLTIDAITAFLSARRPDAHLLDAFGDRPAVSIKPSDVQAFRVGMARKGKGQNTIAHVVGVLHTVLAELVCDGAIPSNAVASLPRGRRPGRPPRRIVVPEPAEVQAHRGGTPRSAAGVRTSRRERASCSSLASHVIQPLT